jgi:hypothetical protein
VLQLEKRIDADIIVARTLIAQKKKERALLALKKKKLSENQLQNIQAYLMNVEGMVRVTIISWQFPWAVLFFWGGAYVSWRGGWVSHAVQLKQLAATCL